jgi:hypothetical protein
MASLDMLGDDAIAEIIAESDRRKLVEPPPPRAHERIALDLLRILHEAEEELIGKWVTTSSGETGPIRGLHLDSLHGLTYTIDPLSPTGVENYSPVSTIKDIEL